MPAFPKSEEPSQVLRIEISGEWTACEFARSFDSLNQLYSLAALLHVENVLLHEFEEYARDAVFDMPPFSTRGYRRLRRLYRERIAPVEAWSVPFINVAKPEESFQLLELSERMWVKRVEFASPGFKDLVGIGEVVGQLKDFVFKLIDLFTSHRKRKLENAMREQNVLSKRIENAKNLVGLAKECGYPETEIRKMVQWTQETEAPLVDLISSGKITDAKIIAESSEEGNPTGEKK